MHSFLLSCWLVWIKVPKSLTQWSRFEKPSPGPRSDESFYSLGLLLVCCTPRYRLEARWPSGLCTACSSPAHRPYTRWTYGWAWSDRKSPRMNRLQCRLFGSVSAHSCPNSGQYCDVWSSFDFSQLSHFASKKIGLSSRVLRHPGSHLSGSSPFSSRWLLLRVFARDAPYHAVCQTNLHSSGLCQMWEDPDPQNRCKIASFPRRNLHHLSLARSYLHCLQIQPQFDLSKTLGLAPICPISDRKRCWSLIVAEGNLLADLSFSQMQSRNFGSGSQISETQFSGFWCRTKRWFLWMAGPPYLRRFPGSFWGCLSRKCRASFSSRPAGKFCSG